MNQLWCFLTNMFIRQNASYSIPMQPNKLRSPSKSMITLEVKTLCKKQCNFKVKCIICFRRVVICYVKCGSSDPIMLEGIPTELRNTDVTIALSEPDQYAKTLGVE